MSPVDEVGRALRTQAHLGVSVQAITCRCNDLGIRGVPTIGLSSRNTPVAGGAVRRTASLATYLPKRPCGSSASALVPCLREPSRKRRPPSCRDTRSRNSTDESTNLRALRRPVRGVSAVRVLVQDTSIERASLVRALRTVQVACIHCGTRRARRGVRPRYPLLTGRGTPLRIQAARRTGSQVAPAPPDRALPPASDFS